MLLLWSLILLVHIFMQVQYLGFGTVQWVILRGRIFKGDLEKKLRTYVGGPQFIQFLGEPNFKGKHNILGGISDLLAVYGLCIYLQLFASEKTTHSNFLIVWVKVGEHYWRKMTKLDLWFEIHSSPNLHILDPKWPKFSYWMVPVLTQRLARSNQGVHSILAYFVQFHTASSSCHWL